MSMQKLTRLRDELEPGDALRQMLVAGSEQEPSEHQLNSLLSRLHALEVPAAAAPTAASPATPFLILLALVAIAGGGWYLARGNAQEHKQAAESAVPAGALPADSDSPATRQSLDEAKTGVDAEPSSREVAVTDEIVPAQSATKSIATEAPVKIASNAPITRLRPAPKVSPIGELEIIRDARQALQTRSWKKVLLLAGDHESRFRDGLLVEEREAIAIEALVGLDRFVVAEARLRRMEARYPKSSYLGRLRAELGVKE